VEDVLNFHKIGCQNLQQQFNATIKFYGWMLQLKPGKLLSEKSWELAEGN